MLLVIRLSADRTVIYPSDFQEESFLSRKGLQNSRVTRNVCSEDFMGHGRNTLSQSSDLGVVVAFIRVTRRSSSLVFQL